MEIGIPQRIIEVVPTELPQDEPSPDYIPAEQPETPDEEPAHANSF